MSADPSASGRRGGGENGLAITRRVFLYSSAYSELHYKSEDVSVPEDQWQGSKARTKEILMVSFQATFGGARCCVSLV